MQYTSAYRSSVIGRLIVMMMRSLTHQHRISRSCCPWVTPTLILAVIWSGSVPALVLGVDPTTLAGSNFCGDFEPWAAEGACTVDGQGNRRGDCQPCLVGEEWDALRAEIGTAGVVGHRKLHPRLATANWASQTIATSMFRIIAEEMLGYDQTEVFTSAIHQLLDEVASPDCQAINLEVWRVQSDSKDIIAHPMGTVGLEALYMPGYASYMSAHHEALKENSLQVLENGEIVYSTDQLPPDGSISPANLSKWYPDSPEYGCTEENRANSGWTASTCVEGRWYPPQCGDTYPSANCKEIYMAQLEWGQGVFESMARNNGLNFSFVYAGYEGIVDIVAEKFSKKENFMYYWWEPEPMHLMFPSREVVLPDHCGSKNVSQDPMLSDNKCGFNDIPLEKRMHKDSALGEPDLQFLFDKWRITKPEMYKILENQKSGGGSMTMEAAACQALKDELVDWKQWLNIHDPCLGQPGKIWSEEERKCVEESSNWMLPAVIGTLCAWALLLAMFALLSWHQRSLRLYVHALENEAVNASATPMSFESPIMMAVHALQEVSSARFVSKNLRESAVKAWSLLLKQDNLYAPAIDDGFVYGESTQHRCDLREAARLAVDMALQDHNESWPSSFRGSKPPIGPSISSSPSNSSLTDSSIDAGTGQIYGNAPCAAIALLEQLETSNEHAYYMKRVSAMLLLDAFHLKAITGDRPLFTATMMALKQHNLIKDLGLDRDMVARFLVKVEDGYQDVPYHNRTHAADVVSRLSSMLLVDDCFGSDESISSKCTVYATILAAAIHDYDHPGTDNNFQVASNTVMACRWNHQNILENHSLYECLEMLRSPSMNALKGTKQNRDHIISMIIKMVLATDMAHHFSILGDFNGKVVSKIKEQRQQAASLSKNVSQPARTSDHGVDAQSSPKSRREWYQSLDNSTRVLVLTVAIKVADIGHTFTTWDTHVHWAQRLEDEFFMQGEQELKLGRVPGMLKHPNKPGVTFPSNQLGFSDVIATPLVKAWAEVFPASGGVLLEECHNNRARWWLKHQEEKDGAKSVGTLDISVVDK